MVDGGVLRLFLCRPLRLAFDGILRDVLVPDLYRQPGLIEVDVGRQGPDEVGRRLVGSSWSSEAAMVAAMGPSLEHLRFHAESREETIDRTLEVHPILVRVVDPDGATPAILRLARGRIASGDLEGYAASVAAGARDDIANGYGPSRLTLARSGSDTFTTLSIWSAWDHIASATGATIHDPIRTRGGARLSSFEVEHYEHVPIPPGGPQGP
jgi:hypothetical protein